MDDLKIFHKDEKTVTSIIKELSGRYGDIMPLSINRSKVHTYLGMILDFTTVGKLIITTYDYITSVIDNAGQSYKIGNGSATPSHNHLYEIPDVNAEGNELL